MIREWPDYVNEFQEGKGDPDQDRRATYFLGEKAFSVFLVGDKGVYVFMASP